MSDSFRPGVQAAKAAGVPVSAREYPAGQAGIFTSLDEIARRIREGAGDPGIKKLAMDALIEQGIDGRNNPTIAQQAGAILKYVQDHTIYAADAGGAEVIQAAHVTLCVRDMCIRGGDCDDLTVATGSMMLAVGLPVYAVRVK